MIRDYGIGGNEVPVEVGDAIADIPQNRTLMIEKLTSDHVTRPEIVKGLKTVDDVFEYYKPKQKVEFQTAEGNTVRELLEFKHLGNFGEKGIVEQSDFLQNASKKGDEYRNITKNLKSNAVLRKVLADSEKKQALLEALNSMIEEINEISNK